ncbi:MAG TPA: helix-turn-helix domain-containing protein [Burkholderiales bacterium]|nr:helix-turn-helix domain-containing protein [Burkholderiales bacterium]
MAGRKPLGPALVEHLEGSASAKERLEMILATIAGQVSVVDAAELLGISEAMFYRLRSRALQVSLEDLEPKPIGRPPGTSATSPEQLHSAALQSRVAELERELAAHTVRLELAQTIPHVLQPPAMQLHTTSPQIDAPASPAAVKKTRRLARQRRQLRQRQRQARRKAK